MAASCVKQALWRASTINRRCAKSSILKTKPTISTLITSKLSTNATNTNKQETHFGFQSVSEEEKESKVYEVFENVASKYDLMNDAMSGVIHRIWKDIFLERFSPVPGTRLLDVAGGTGDIAFRFLKYVRTPNYLQG